MTAEPTPMTAPIAERRDHTFSVHGITVSDPYHWLKDQSYPTIDDADILAYVRAENAWFEQVMAPHQEQLDDLFAELKARQVEDDESVPYRYNGFLYRWRFETGQQYRVHERAPTSDPSNWQIILNGPALAEGHDYFNLGAMAVSPSGNLLAYLLDTEGGERYTLHITDLSSGEHLPLHADNLSGNLEWSGDDAALFVVDNNEQWRPYRVRRLSLDGSRSEIVYHEQNEGVFVGISTTSSERYLVIDSGDHESSELRTIDLSKPDQEPVLVAPRRERIEVDLDHRGEYFYLLTNDTHSNFRVARRPIDATGLENWETILEGDDHLYLRGLDCFARFLVVSERIDGLDQIHVMPYPGETDTQAGTADHRIAFPETTYTVGLGSNAEFEAPVLRLAYESMVTPDTVFDYDVEGRSLTTLKVKAIPSGYDAELYATERLTIAARDGEQVPVSIVYRKDTPRDGTAPLWLYGYGAYGITIDPGFSANRLSLLNRGWIYAIAHIRGGDDLGRRWYLDGKLDKRTNTFNDFVDVANGLIERSYTRAGRIASSGGSAGGKLMGAVVNQAPELFGAVVAHVPFVDVLNTMLDTSLPLTPLEWPEWGNPIEDKAAFELIRSYSPYDQVEARSYPPMLVTAGLNDPRVTYWEPAKWVAKLRYLKTDTNPLLLKTNMGAGHGGRSGRFEALYELAEEYTFVLSNLETGASGS